MSKIMEFFKEISDIKKRGDGLEKGFETHIDDEVIEKYFGDDSKTRYKIGDRVKKATEEWGDVHKKGTEYIIAGAMYDNGREIYMVHTPDSKEMSMTLTYKIEPI